MMKFASASFRTSASRRLARSTIRNPIVAAREIAHESGHGCVCPGSVLPQPASEPLGPLFGVRLDRFVSEPVFEIVGEGAAPFRIDPRASRAIAFRQTASSPLAIEGSSFRGGENSPFLHGTEHDPEVIALERWLAGEHAIQGSAQAVDVAAWSKAIQVPRGLLWAHIGGRPHGRAW